MARQYDHIYSPVKDILNHRQLVGMTTNILFTIALFVPEIFKF